MGKIMGKTLKMPKNEINTMLKQLQTKKALQKAKKECMKGYCNPDCKNTIFQAGKEIPSGAYHGIAAKAKAPLKRMLEPLRKRIFGNKTNVLKNSFYNRLPATNVTRAKKQGALSGCSIKIVT